MIVLIFALYRETNLVLSNSLLGQEISVLLSRVSSEVGRGPQIRGQEAGSSAQSIVHSHRQVTSGTRVTGGGGVHILNTSHGQKLLRDKRSNDTGTTRGGDQTAAHGTALAGHLAGHGVGKTGVKTPVTTTNGDQVHLGVDDTTTDGTSNFLGSLKAKTDVAVAITDSDVAFEASALTSGGLLLDRHDLHDLILEGRANKVVHNLVLLDGKREQEDLLDGSDLALLHEAAELGHGDPLLLLALVASSAATSATATAAFAVTTAAKK